MSYEMFFGEGEVAQGLGNYVVSLFRKYSQPSRDLSSQKEICILVFNLLCILVFNLLSAVEV